MLVNTSHLPDIDHCNRLEGDEQHTQSFESIFTDLSALKLFNFLVV